MIWFIILIVWFLIMCMFNVWYKHRSNKKAQEILDARLTDKGRNLNEYFTRQETRERR